MKSINKSHGHINNSIPDQNATQITKKGKGDLLDNLLEKDRLRNASGSIEYLLTQYGNTTDSALKMIDNEKMIADGKAKSKSNFYVGYLYKMVSENLKKFEGLDYQKVADKFFEVGQGYYVAHGLKDFTGLNHQDIADRLEKAGNLNAVAKNLEQFEGIDHQVLIDKLFEEGKTTTWILGDIADNFNKFKGIDHQKTADRLIEAGEVNRLAARLEHFKGLNVETLNKVIDSDHAINVLKNLKSFVSVDRQDAYRRIVKKILPSQVAENLEFFIGIKHRDLVNRLIEDGKEEYVKLVLNELDI